MFLTRVIWITLDCGALQMELLKIDAVFMLVNVSELLCISVEPFSAEESRSCRVEDLLLRMRIASNLHGKDTMAWSLISHIRRCHYGM